MLRALVEHGVRPDLVVGSSVGAINAAFFAARPDLEGVHRLAEIWKSIRRDDVFRVSALGGLTGLLSGRGHLADPVPLRKLIERWIPYHRLEDTRIPCMIVATELMGGDEARLSSGPVVEALLASTALPAIFPPVSLGGRLLLDGMVASHTPIFAAISAGATRIVVLPTGNACALSRPPKGALALALHALNLIIARQIAADAERYADRARLIVVPPLCPLAVASHDFSQTDALMKRAETATRAWLAADGLERRTAIETLRTHHHARSVLEG